MSAMVEQYIAVSIVYFIMCGLVCTKAVPSKVGKIVLATMFSIMYGYITFLFAASLQNI